MRNVAVNCTRGDYAKYWALRHVLNALLLSSKGDFIINNNLPLNPKGIRSRLSKIISKLGLSRPILLAVLS
jgi:hypothetical protein